MEGREPLEVTDYEYDDAGRLVRAVTSRESEWTEQDTAEQLALAEYRDTLCGCCGMPKAIVQGPEKDLPRLVVSKRYCHARRTLIESQQAFTRNGKEFKPAHGALQWSIRMEKG